ncbi:MAG: large subunit ribosomal protein L2 [Alphaproteobacteria bacterium]|jgi:large subunit ribosomal protein L2
MLKQFKPTTPGNRGLVLVDKSKLYKGSSCKKLTVSLNKKSGRNNTGRVTLRGRSGGAKKLYRIIDFKRSKYDIPAIVDRIEYDPNRTAFIALITYQDGEQSYIIAPDKLKVGDTIISSSKVDVVVGNSSSLSSLPVGTIVHNVEVKIAKGAQYCRSAGTYAQILGRDGKNVIVKLSSGEVRLIDGRCRATIGVVSNSDHSNQNLGKAGRRRHMGRRPIVRGVAMNPIDHPHGGGEGRTSGGRHPVSYTGVPKGKKTVRKKNPVVIRKRTTRKGK